VTALSDDDRRQKMLEAGAADYVTKPIDVASLKQRVKALLEVQ